MWPNPLETAEFTFTEENLNGKVHFFVQCCYFSAFLSGKVMITLHKKLSFPTSISSVNVTKYYFPLSHTFSSVN